MRKNLFNIIAVLGLASIAGAAVWSSLEADRYKLTNSGVLAFTADVDSNGAAVVNDITGKNGPSLKVNQGGGVVLSSFSATQLISKTPKSVGELVYNSTIKTVCISSGTGIGAWVFLQNAYGTGVPSSSGKGPCWTDY